jgi:Ca2+-binding RTX toxin-like protein
MAYVTYSVSPTSFTDILQVTFDYYIEAYVDPETFEYFGDTIWNATYTQIGGTGTGFNSGSGAEGGFVSIDIYSLWEPGIVHYHVDFRAENSFSAVAIDESFDIISAYYDIAPVTINGTTNNDFIFGGAGSDTLNGDFGADRFYGGAGADTMSGGAGDDTYYDPFGDTIIEGPGLLGGTDFVIAAGTFSLSGIANVEYLTLTGSGNFDATGNAQNNYLRGNTGDNRLRGGSGVDTLAGGAGNDTYVDPTGDRILEFSFQGTADAVESSATFSLASPGLEWIEILTLTGAGNINGAGNGLGNIITGNAGNNILNGNAGADTMIGGAGNDTYYVDNAGDQVIETSGGGTDIVSSSVSRTLSVSVENLNLSGSANIDGNGNDQANIIRGNGGNNILRGYDGSDTLESRGGADILLGGHGRDTLNPGNDADIDKIRFSSVADSTGALRDVVIGLDLNDEDRLDFTLLPAVINTQVNFGALNAASFNANLAAAVNASLSVNGAILFDPSAGDLNIAGHVYLVVDANGDGSYTANADYVVQLINPTGALTLDDFI